MPCAASIILLLPALFAQSFEVASVKVHPGPASIIQIKTSGAQFTAEAEMIGGLILYAYNLRNYQLSLGSSKFDDVYYDIVAKADGDTAPTKEDFRHMLKALLAARFKLQVHHEMRELPVLALLVGKNGPKFRESPSDATVSGRFVANGRNQTMTLSKATMEEVASDLGVYTSRPVVDKTGLTGTYEIRLEATPAFRLNSTPDPADTSIFAAVQEQLGLKLEAQKSMIDVLVVDHVEKPSGN